MSDDSRSDIAALATLVDATASAVDGVRAVYGSAPHVLGVVSALAGGAARSVVRRRRDALEVVVSIGVDAGSDAAAPTAARVASAVRSAVLDAGASGDVRVTVRVSRILS